MSDGDGGYVHDPSDFDDERATRVTDEAIEGERDASGEDDREPWLDDPTHPETADREFGRRGWVLVCVIVFAFVVSPLAILFWPPDYDYYVALLILPLAPAVLLALTAVWATTRP